MMSANGRCAKCQYLNKLRTFSSCFIFRESTLSLLMSWYTCRKSFLDIWFSMSFNLICENRLFLISLKFIWYFSSNSLSSSFFVSIISARLSSLPSMVLGISRYKKRPITPLTHTIIKLQNPTDIMPPNLNVVWKSTMTVPNVQRKICNSSQYFSTPNREKIFRRLRAMYPNSPTIISKVPMIPKPWPINPLGFNTS